MQKILYIHIPKAGGSAINAYFSERLGKTACLPHAENLLAGAPIEPSNAPDHRFVSAHMIYPRLRTHFVEQARFTMTVLRRPIEQTMSHLAWVRFQTDPAQKRAFSSLPDFLKDLAQRMKSTDLGNPVALEKFLAGLEPRELAFFDNCQTRYLVPNVKGPLAPGVVERARTNLQALDLVGIAEKMQDVFDVLSWRLGLAPAEGDRRVNPSRYRYGLDPTDEALREVLRPYVRLDEQLYEQACRLFGASVYKVWTEIDDRAGKIINRKRIHDTLQRGVADA